MICPIGNHSKSYKLVYECFKTQRYQHIINISPVNHTWSFFNLEVREVICIPYHTFFSIMAFVNHIYIFCCESSTFVHTVSYLDFVIITE